MFTIYIYKLLYCGALVCVCVRRVEVRNRWCSVCVCVCVCSSVTLLCFHNFYFLFSYNERQNKFFVVFYSEANKILVLSCLVLSCLAMFTQYGQYCCFLLLQTSGEHL